MSLDTLLGLTVQCHEMFWHPLFGSFHSDDQTTLQTIEKSDRLWGFPTRRFLDSTESNMKAVQVPGQH